MVNKEREKQLLNLLLENGERDGVVALLKGTPLVFVGLSCWNDMVTAKKRG